MPQQVEKATATMFPFASYQDAAAAVDWLVEAFGFERKEVHEGEDGTIAHAELAYGGSVYMLGSARDGGFGMKTPREVGAVTGGVYVYVDDLDEHYERAKAAGA